MPSIILSDKTYKDLISRSDDTKKFRPDAYMDLNDKWVVPVSDEVYHQLKTLQLEGETDDDTLVRTFAIRDKHVS